MSAGITLNLWARLGRVEEFQFQEFQFETLSFPDYKKKSTSLNLFIPYIFFENKFLHFYM